MDQTDTSVLDRPEILSVLFHPRPEWPGSLAPAHARDLMIPVADDVAVGARFHPADRSAPNILFFHGNGEIAAFDKPTLVIHAERDHLIPLEEGLHLYQACWAKDKTLLKIPGADHINIFLLGMNEYLDGLRGLVEKALKADVPSTVWPGRR